MKRLLLLPLLLGLYSPVLADLGEAESAINKMSTFNVWCGKLKNDCVVTFDGDFLKVNGGEGITAGQILMTDEKYDTDLVLGRTTTFTVTYKKRDGKGL